MNAKVQLVQDEGCCVINGKKFPCTIHEPCGDVTISIHNEHPATWGHKLDVPDLANLLGTDLPLKSSIDILYPTTAFAHVCYVAIERRMSGMRLAISLYFSYQTWLRPCNLRHFLAEMRQSYEPHAVQCPHSELRTDEAGVSWTLHFEPRAEEAIVAVLERRITEIRSAYDAASVRYPESSEEEVEDLLRDVKSMPAGMQQQLTKLQLHPRLLEVAGQLFVDGHYRQAILDAYIALVEAVKRKTGLTVDNVPLMEQAFSPRNPRLQLSADSDEQQGYMRLFSGAVQAIRNPKAHRLIQQTDPGHTLEWLCLASALFRLLDQATLQSASGAP
jgi:uncharacterized protein (TIGR02391 family)